MKNSSKTAMQLIKAAKRGGGLRQTKTALYALAERIEKGPIRSCVPKKKQREAGLLPKL